MPAILYSLPKIVKNSNTSAFTGGTAQRIPAGRSNGRSAQRPEASEMSIRHRLFSMRMLLAKFDAIWSERRRPITV